MEEIESKARSTKTIITDYISHNRTFSNKSDEEEWKDTITNLKNERLLTFNIDIYKYLGNRVLEKKYWNKEI